MKKSVKQKYEDLLETAKNYTARWHATRSVTALEVPAYGRDGEPNDPSAKPNVVFVKDLINQVMTAKSLGYNTVLYSDGKFLSVEFKEPKPQPPVVFTHGV